MSFDIIAGGVTSPKGFLAAGVHCGIRKNPEKKDLGAIYSGQVCAAAAVYTQNRVKAAPVLVTQRHLKNFRAQAVVVNSGNANACTAYGEEKAETMCSVLAEQLGISHKDVIVASTGVIGQPLPIKAIETAIPQLCGALSDEGGSDAAEAIMTTDTLKKEQAVRFEVAGKTVTIGGMAKGSGMIHPNMATLLCFLTTDALISDAALSDALSQAVGDTFNMLTVDGDTSTNDMACIMASGMAENEEIILGSDDYDRFAGALTELCAALCRMMAKDGEGATKLLECRVTGAESEETAKKIAKAVMGSPLCKTAMFGSDANWGRVLCAVGYAGVPVDVEQVDIRFSSAAGVVAVCRGGQGVEFSEERAKAILQKDEIVIHVQLNAGECTATAYGCDLTYDYVKINGDYRT